MCGCKLFVVRQESSQLRNEGLGTYERVFVAETSSPLRLVGSTSIMTPKLKQEANNTRTNDRVCEVLQVTSQTRLPYSPQVSCS